MALSSFVGSFAIDPTKTAGQDQQITGVGFQPSIILFWWSGTISGSDTVTGETHRRGFGVAKSASIRYFIGTISVDAGGSADTANFQDDTACIGILADPATVEGLADFKTFDSDGFTLTIDDQFANAYIISFLALAGVDSYVNSLSTPGATGEQIITGVGFQPKAVLFFGGVNGVWAGSVGSHSLIGFGWATGSSNQCAWSGRSRDNQTTMNTIQYIYNGECYALVSPTAAAVVNRATFVGTSSDGFTINWLERNSSAVVCYVALGGSIQAIVGDFLSQTDTTTTVQETTNFEPKALMFLSGMMAVSAQDTISSHDRISLGAAVSISSRVVQSISDENGLVDAEVATGIQYDGVYYNIADDATVGIGDISAIDSTSFTFIMDDADASQNFISYLVLGDSGASNYPFTGRHKALFEGRFG